MSYINKIEKWCRLNTVKVGVNLKYVIFLVFLFWCSIRWWYDDPLEPLTNSSLPLISNDANQTKLLIYRICHLQTIFEVDVYIFICCLLINPIFFWLHDICCYYFPNHGGSCFLTIIGSDPFESDGNDNAIRLTIV